MTVKEAIEGFKVDNSLLTENEGGTIERNEMAIEALEKQIPMKPQEVLLAYGKGYECKNCGNELSINEFNGKYCNWCGQAIDWQN